MEKIYAVDWSHKIEKLAVHNGESLCPLPKPEPSIVLVTENMPKKMALPFLTIGAKVLRCSPNATADKRKQVQKSMEWEKTDQNDARLIWMLFKHFPELFRPMNIDPPLVAYYNIFKDFQEVRIRTNNRLFAEQDNEVLGEFFSSLTKTEKALSKSMENEVKKHFMYDWLSGIRGIGTAMAGGLLALLNDIDRFPSVAKLWAYSGYRVDDGKVQKHKAGKVSNWNSKVRCLMFNVVDMFIKHRTPIYRQLYDDEKARQLEKGIPLGHAHNRAIRRTAKQFLKDYWIAAKKTKQTNRVEN